jgi:regulator of RNase E activity RraA
MIDTQKYKTEIAEISMHSTTVVADAMDKFGSVPDLALIAGMPHNTKAAGPVYYVETYRESNWHLHESLQQAPEGAVVFVEPVRCNKRAIFGEIVMDYIMRKRKAQGVIVNGYMRDIEGIIPKQYPLWYKGNNPVGCFNKKVDKPDLESVTETLLPNRHYYDHPENSICVADAAGVVVIPEQKISRVCQRVKEIAHLEGIWTACIEAGLSTFETICQRAYENPEKVSGQRFERVRELYQKYLDGKKQ